MKWNYNIEKAPRNIGLLCYCSSGLKLLIKTEEEYGILRRDEDKDKQEYRDTFREYPDAVSRTYKPLCWMLPDLPNPEKFHV